MAHPLAIKKCIDVNHIFLSSHSNICHIFVINFHIVHVFVQKVKRKKRKTFQMKQIVICSPCSFTMNASPFVWVRFVWLYAQLFYEWQMKQNDFTQTQYTRLTCWTATTTKAEKIKQINEEERKTRNFSPFCLCVLFLFFVFICVFCVIATCVLLFKTPFCASNL